MGDRVGPDGIHGVGIKTINGVEVDLSTVEVVGEFVGSQMAAFDAEASVGLIDHVQDGVPMARWWRAGPIDHVRELRSLN
jgi:hypothetical protein